MWLNRWWCHLLPFFVSLYFLLRFVLCPKIWSVLVNVPWTFEKNVDFAFVGSSVLLMSVTFCWLMMLFSSFMSLMIFYLVIEWVAGRRVLKFPTLIVDLSFFFFFFNFTVFAPGILELCYLACTHLGFLCFLGGIFLYVPLWPCDSGGGLMIVAGFSAFSMP